MCNVNSRKSIAGGRDISDDYAQLQRAVTVSKDEFAMQAILKPQALKRLVDTEYLAAWRTLVLPLLNFFQPDFIFVSAGFDAARGHSAALGGYNLSPQVFGYFTRTLLNYANGKVVLALEGGYDLPSICDSAEECVKALCADGGDLTRLRPESLEAIPSQAAQDTIQKVIAIHNKQWPCLTGHQGLATSELHWQTISKQFSTLTVHS